MISLLIGLPILCLVIGIVVGFYVGRYQAQLLEKIRTLESRPEPVKPAEPGVVLGPSYIPPHQLSTSPDNRSVGLVEPKTPERVEWEARQAIEKEGLGR